ncbi:hypothetical protein JCM11491_003467 [Sporobolomyces phaffii]
MESDTPASVPSTAPADRAAREERIARHSTNVLPEDYEFDPSFSVDENWMVLTLIYARLSMSKRGNMACIVVDPTEPEPRRDDSSEPPQKRSKLEPPASESSHVHQSEFPNYPGRVLSHSNNFPQPHTVPVDLVPKAGTKGKQAAKPKPGQTHFLVKASQFPELHAEARSICLAAAHGVTLSGATAYVSFPPCAACLPLLVASRIKRLVYRQALGTAASVELCRGAGVECVEIVDKAVDERIKDRANQWWKDQGEGKEETRGRLERWWNAREQEIMGKLYAAAREDRDRREESDATAELSSANPEGNDT